MDSISPSYETCDRLPDGRRVYLRPIRPGDRERLREEFLKLSKDSVRDRFFSIKLDLTPKELSYFTEIDLSEHVALVAELDIDGERHPAGVGRFVKSAEQPNHSEMAITVAEEMQGLGIGKVLLHRLIECARQLGVAHLDATVMADNKRMTYMLHKTGLPLRSRLEDGIKTICLDL